MPESKYKTDRNYGNGNAFVCRDRREVDMADMISTSSQSVQFILVRRFCSDPSISRKNPKMNNI